MQPFMNVTAHLTDEQFQNYKNRKIPIIELLVISDHLAECKECREKLGGTEERAAILEALTRDLQSAVVNGSHDLTYKEPAANAEAEPNPQETSPKTSATAKLLQNQYAAILPVVIGIAAIVLLFGLLIALFFKDLL